MHNTLIGFIGAGNMATSLIAGMLNKDMQAQHIYASDPNTEHTDELARRFGIHVTNRNVDLLLHCDVIVLAIKPQILPMVVSELAQHLADKTPLIISIAAGITSAQINAALGGQYPIVRCMPNTPALLGVGASGLYANDYVNESQRELAESILRCVGIVEWFSAESDIDIVTALSGSGPAYFFALMESMQQAAIDLGLSADAAKLLCMQTALGAAKMALESNVDVATLRERVTSPGGTTEAALQSLAQDDFSAIVHRAIDAASKRARELSQGSN